MKTKRIALNEVKNGLSKVVEEVESGQEVIITKHGRDAVLIKPLSNEKMAKRAYLVKPAGPNRALIREATVGTIRAALEELDRLAEQIGKHWQGDMSAVDAIREQRREL